MEQLGHREVVGRRKLGRANSDGFLFFRWEAVGDGVLMDGCVSSGVFVSGKRKGRPRYDGPTERVFVSDAEMTAEHKAYEARTGNCGKCIGEGRVWHGWHHIEGNKYIECSACVGTGRLQRVEAAS